jgi:hypothetical protein
MASAILPLFFILTTAFAQPLGNAKEAELNQEFDIRVGASVWIENEGLKVSFSHVAEDSRCPEGVACVWAGNGKIVLKLSKRGRIPGKINLNTMLEPKQASYRGYDIKLVKLEPYPKKDLRMKKNAYVATLIVSRK